MLSCFSPARLFVILWTIAHQAPLTMGFSRHEYWSGSPCPPHGDLPVLGIKPMSRKSLVLQAGSSQVTGATWEAQQCVLKKILLFTICKFFCCSVAKSCLTLCDRMNCSMPSFPILHYLFEFAQTQYSCLENPMDGGAW